MNDRLRNLSFTTAVIGTVCVLSLWLRSAYPVRAIGGAGHDDYLFVRLAISLRDGHWLGPYDNLVLAKGMFFPLFIAVSEIAGIPLPISEQILYLTVAVFAFAVLRRLTGNQAVSLVVFGFLALNPVFWNDSLSRVIREGVYISLSLALFLLTFVILNFTISRQLTKIALTTLAGCFAAAYWLTREEGLWLLPSLGMMTVLSLFSHLKHNRTSGQPWSNIQSFVRTTSPMLVSSGVIAVLLVSGVATVNFFRYGVFADVEFRASGFLSAYGALSRLKSSHPQRFVVFPKEVRQQAYALSPAAAELESYFEGAGGEAWRRIGCQSVRITPCQEILSGWFVWALRDAVSSAGHYSTADRAEAFYYRLAKEINDGCDAGKVQCLAPRKSLQPPFKTEFLVESFALLPKALRILIGLEQQPRRTYASVGADDRLELFEAMVGPVAKPESHETPTSISGWIATREGTPQLKLANSKTGEFINFRLRSAPDVDRAFAGRGYSGLRFDQQLGTLKCQKNDCDLKLEIGAEVTKTIPTSTLHVGSQTSADNFVLYIDSLSDSPDAKRADAIKRSREQLVRRFSNVIAPVWTSVMALGFFTACIGLLFGGIFYLRLNVAERLLVAMCSCSFLAVLTRGALLAYIDVSSFSALHFLYLSPANPFLIIFVGVGTWLFLLNMMKVRNWLHAI